MKNIFSLWLINLYGLFLCFGLITTSFYFELEKGLQPCPLCILQRLCIMLLALLFGIGLFCKRVLLLRIQSIGVIIMALFGAGFSLRQIYLQHITADEVPACGPSLSYMLQNLPFSTTLKLLFEGTGECSEISWQWLGLSMPQWLLGFFILFLIFGIVHLKRATKIVSF